MAEFRRIEDWLQSRGFISCDQLRSAEEEALANHSELLFTLIQTGVLTERQVAEGYSHLYRIPLVDVGKVRSSKEARAFISPGIAISHLVLPLKVFEGALTCAIADPLNVDFIQDLKGSIPLKLNLVLATPSELTEAIVKSYRLRKIMVLRNPPHETPAPATKVTGFQIDREELLAHLSEVA